MGDDAVENQEGMGKEKPGKIGSRDLDGFFIPRRLSTIRAIPSPISVVGRGRVERWVAAG